MKPNLSPTVLSMFRRKGGNIHAQTYTDNHYSLSWATDFFFFIHTLLPEFDPTAAKRFVGKLLARVLFSFPYLLKRLQKTFFDLFFITIEEAPVYSKFKRLSRAHLERVNFTRHYNGTFETV